MEGLDNYQDRQTARHIDEIEWLADLEEEATTIIENGDLNFDEMIGQMPSELVEIIGLAFLNGEMVSFADPMFDGFRKREIDRQIAAKFEELKRA